MWIDRLLRPFEPLFLVLDRLGGGRQAGIRIAEADRTHPKTRRAFTWVMWLLVVEIIIGFSSVVIALSLAAQGAVLPVSVWTRTFVVFAMTASLFYFAWRAQLGWRWAYSRLRLFGQIFPVVTLVMAAIPGLYPAWMVTEQIIFSLIMIGIADFLLSDHMRRAFRKPETVADATESVDASTEPVVATAERGIR
ncbi:MAG TPA: hypothetical protein VFU07_04470 [Candidatus Lumbricidophila sp.]|nr:hypothetical protein [Candidatus Lumbricidophila sp.]